MPHKITLEIPDDIFDEIIEYKKRKNITEDNIAIFELLKYAVTLPEYFENFDWEKAEKEASGEIASGKIRAFDSVDEFLNDLRK